MDSSSGHNQEMRTSSEQPMNNMAGPGAGPAKGGPGERKPRPAGDQQALKCPRCESANTKFCYYNNYSLTQPRYFCKSCRRYWTKGGTLRNVPVGGGCRKNRRPSSSSSSSSSASAKRAPHDHLLAAAATTNSATGSFPILPPPPPLLLPPAYDQNDLTLAFSRLQNEQQLCSMFGNASSGFLDALKTGFLDSSSSSLSHHNSNATVNYYGYNLNNSGNTTYDNDDDDNNDRIALEDHRQTMVKNELCSGSYNNASIMRSSSHTNNDHNRVLWGLPWQLNGSLDHNNINGNMVDFDASTTTSSTGREIWNGFAPSNWHGLLNTTPLM